MKLHWLLPTIKGIPVLMYHRVWPDLQDGLTVTPEQLTEQWRYLKEKGYHGIGLTEFIAIAKGEEPINGKPVLITFDDGYKNNLTYAYPLLKEMNWKATIFIIGDTVHNRLQSKNELEQTLSLEELKSIDPQIIQFGMHGFYHENFSKTSLNEIKVAIEKSIETFRENNIPLSPVIAYPYGSRPKDKAQFDELKKWMKENGVEAAFRIGNKPVKIPVRDIYEIKRIDIRGTDSLEDFKIKLRKGKLKSF